MMGSQTQSLFKYEFVAFFTWWWGLALLYLTYQADKASAAASTYESYLGLSIILLAIGLYSLISRARAVMDDRRKFAQTTQITP
jgi:hypothetical protein